MNVLEHFHTVKGFVFDVDGVLTDGTVLLLENGLQARTMHVRDGLALQMAQKMNYPVVVVSGGNSAPVLQRLQYLGIKEIHLGVHDKVSLLNDVLDKLGLPWEQVLFMGDDLPDVPVMQQCGMPCCPADAAIEVQKISKYISPVKGGYGCVRDVIEKVMKLNDQWQYTTDVSSR